jgi:hypothetical protein
VHRNSAAAIRHGLQLAHWNISDLWVAAVGIGGALSHHDVDQIASGERLATPGEHDILALALNEHFVDRDQDQTISYWHDLPGLPG